MWASLGSLLEIETHGFHPRLLEESCFFKQDLQISHVSVRSTAGYNTMASDCEQLLLMPCWWQCTWYSHFGKFVVSIQTPPIKVKSTGKTWFLIKLFFTILVKKKRKLTILKYTKLYTAQWVIRSECIYLMKKKNFYHYSLALSQLQPVLLLESNPLS